MLSVIFVFVLFSQKDPVTNICQAADKQLFTLVEWAKRIPHFTELPLEDQVILLRAGMLEMLSVWCLLRDCYIWNCFASIEFSGCIIQ